MTGPSTASATEIACRLTGYSGAEGEARLRIRGFERPARVRRALAALGASWAAALAAVLIPVAHFVLVPGLAVFGLFLFGQRLRTSAVVVVAHGTCPDCGVEQDLDILGPWREGRGVSCRHCHRPLRLSPV